MSTGDLGDGLLFMAWVALCVLAIAVGLLYLLAGALFDIGTAHEHRLVFGAVCALAVVGPGFYFWKLNQWSGP